MQRICVSFAIDVDAGILSAFIRVIRVIRDSAAKSMKSAKSVILCAETLHTLLINST